MLHRLFILAVILLLCSGCYAHDTAITVNRDGSGSIEVTGGINKAYERGEVAAGRLAADSDIARVILNGFQSTSQDLSPDWKPTIVAWDDGTFAGAKLTLTFTNVTMLQAQVAKLLALTQDSGRNDLLTDMQARQGNDQIDITAAFEGQTLTTDDGAPLPSGAEGIGRVGWSVTMPQVDSAAPTAYATRNGNTVRWAVPLVDLKPGTALQLTTSGRLIAANATALATALPTAQLIATTSATTQATAPTATTPPIVASSPTASTSNNVQPTVAAVVIPTTTSPSATALPSVGTPQVPVSPTVQLPSSNPVSTLPPVPAPATPAAPVILPTAQSLPTAQPASRPLTPVAPAAFTPVAAIATLQAASTAPASTSQAFVPIAAGSAPTQASTPLPGASRPAQSYQVVTVAVLLICSALCFGYVGVRRLRRRPKGNEAK